MTTMLLLGLVAAAVGAAAGSMVVMILGRKKAEGEIDRARGEFEERIRQLEASSENEVEQRIREAELSHKDELLRHREEIERQNQSRVDEIQKIEERLLQREEALDKRRETLDSKELSVERREGELSRREENVRQEESRLKELQAQEMRKLEEIAGMSAETAKQELKDRFMEESRLDIAADVQRMEKKAKENVERNARQLVALSVERYASEHVAESTVSVVDLPTDEMKGRIIGREGRNIRALEMATGVDIIIDDTPEAVVVSGFDKVRRETARLALEALVQDGRIHPGRIEEVVKKTKSEIDARIKEAGEQAAFELGLEGMIHPDLIFLLGRMRYRTSYSQNVLKHSIEVAHLCGMMASELGLENTMAKRAGLLHDIGKAATHEVEGSHVQIGFDLAKKYNEPSEVLNAILSHHEDEEPNCIESLLVKASDTLSAARPGARREMVESYIKRLEALEKIGESFKGVEKCFAIQAGREIRVAVLPDEISDAQATFLAHDIAKRIETERTYPGEILVTVIRETRHTATAR